MDRSPYHHQNFPRKSCPTSPGRIDRYPRSRLDGIIRHECRNTFAPALAGDLLILICDQDDHSYLLAVHKKTGETAWRAERPQFRRSFSSPFLWRHQGQEELVVPGSLWLKSYRPTDGKELWSYTRTSRVANHH